MDPAPLRFPLEGHEAKAAQQPVSRVCGPQGAVRT